MYDVANALTSAGLRALACQSLAQLVWQFQLTFFFFLIDLIGFLQN